jgi:DNA-binding HxlR family transcriptional regulator
MLKINENERITELEAMMRLREQTGEVDPYMLRRKLDEFVAQGLLKKEDTFEVHYSKA